MHNCYCFITRVNWGNSGQAKFLIALGNFGQPRVIPSLHFMYAFPKISGVENLFLWRSGVSWRAGTTIGVTLAQDAAALAYAYFWTVSLSYRHETHIMLFLISFDPLFWSPTRRSSNCAHVMLHWSQYFGQYLYLFMLEKKLGTWNINMLHFSSSFLKSRNSFWKYNLLLTFPLFIHLPPSPNSPPIFQVWTSYVYLFFFFWKCNVTTVNITFFQKHINIGEATRICWLTGCQTSPAHAMAFYKFFYSVFCSLIYMQKWIEITQNFPKETLYFYKIASRCQ